MKPLRTNCEHSNTLFPAAKQFATREMSVIVLHKHSVPVTDQHKLQVHEKEILNKIFGPNRNEVTDTEHWRK
jgi:hypothetical protein